MFHFYSVFRYQTVQFPAFSSYIIRSYIELPYFHVIHTQVVVDNTGKICHIQSSFLRHQNDAQHFRLMSQIGHHQDLDFPQNVVLLADRIYPNGYPLMTPYTRRQLNVRPDNVRRRTNLV
jgi:hypothetical protein